MSMFLISFVDKHEFKDGLQIPTILLFQQSQ